MTGLGSCNWIGDEIRDSGRGMDEGDMGCVVGSGSVVVPGASKVLSTGGGTRLGDTLDEAAGVVSFDVSPMVNAAALSRSSRVNLCALGGGGLF
jgi:hypothetical protein